MIDLRQNNIRLNAKAANKTEAIHLAGGTLVDSGNIKSGYIDSMLAREQVANTYLGNGIAIPHGLPKDRELILKTGISVTQLPDGVEWNRGEKVYLVVGIAARSDEHIEVLSNLTHVLGDAETIQRLAKTDNHDDIIETLTRKPAPKTTPAPDDAALGFTKGVDLAISSSAGLHARPATAFVHLAKQFDSEIRVRHGDQVANGKSLVALLQLGADSGAKIRILAKGADEDPALQALREAVESGLEEEEEQTAPGAAVAPAARTPALSFESKALPGIAAAPGIAIGPLHQFQQGKVVVASTANDPVHEYTCLKQAIETARVQLNDLYQEVKEKSGADKAAIFKAHEEFLDDPDLLNEASQRIHDGHSAGWSWREAVEERAGVVRRLGDPLLAQRATDLQDVGRRVLKLLADTVEEDRTLPDHPVVLVAEDLTPSDTARLDPALVLGLCTASGGPTSHTAIIARSLDIPAIVGAGPAILHQPDGQKCVLDGERGNLYVEPTSADLETARQAQKDYQSMREAERLACYQPAIMTDGHRIEVVANIGAPEEAERAVNAGGEGVGLLRTEFLFLQRSEPPGEDEQFAAYSEMTRALNGLPLIVRTLDVGGDKNVPFLDLPAEQNPFLGLRGIRLCLARPELFKTQLRAIYRAAASGPVSLMFPMIASLEDLAAARAIAEQVRRDLHAEPVPIGIMIEVPAAVMIAEELAREADFFSIGTNDLTQYTLAMDRGHPILAKQADALHPAVLRMIDRTVRAADKAGIQVGVCGGIAADPKGATILAGLGVAELSVAIPSIAAVKAKLRTVSWHATQEFAQRALQCRSANDVRALNG